MLTSLPHAYTLRTSVRFPHFYEEKRGELSLLRIELPHRCGDALCRWCAAIARRLGVRDCLDEGLLPWLPLMESRELWQERAAEAALRLLQQRSIPPQLAVVGICARYPSRQVVAAAETLSDCVRTIALDTGDNEGLASWLRSRNGVSVLVGRGDVTLCFDPEEREGCINLGVARPQVEGLSLEWRSGADSSPTLKYVPFQPSGLYEVGDEWYLVV